MEQVALRLRDVLSFGIPGTPFTVGKLVLLAALLVLLLYFNRRFTRWISDSFLARRHLDVGVRQAVGTLVRSSPSASPTGATPDHSPPFSCA